MRDDDDYEDYESGDGEEEGASGAAVALCHWIEERYVGDSRFETVELLVPGQLEGEDARALLVVDSRAHFFVAVHSAEEIVRVGLAVEDVETSEAVEREILDRADSFTELLEEAMGGDEAEHEMKHFEDDVYYFCSEIHYDGEERLKSRSMREEIVLYLDAYVAALIEIVESAS